MSTDSRPPNPEKDGLDLDAYLRGRGVRYPFNVTGEPQNTQFLAWANEVARLRSALAALRESRGDDDEKLRAARPVNASRGLAAEIDVLLTGTFPFPWIVEDAEIDTDDTCFDAPRWVRASDGRFVIDADGQLQPLETWTLEELRANAAYIVGAEPLLRRAAAILKGAADEPAGELIKPQHEARESRALNDGENGDGCA